MVRRFTVLVVVVALLVSATAAPVLANDNLRCKDLRGDAVRCDGDRFVGDNDNDFFDFDREDFFDFDDDFDFDDSDVSFIPLFNDFGFNDNSCPFWNDFSGVVNWTDCLD